MSKKILVVAFILLARLSYGQSAQSNTGYSSQAVNQIEQAVRARYGAGYEVYAVAVDTLIGKALPDGYADFCDPNHLLRGALLFNAVRPPDYADSSIFGIYKDGAVRWMSESVIDGYLQEIIGITDLLGDGTVDILTTWNQTGTAGDQSDLWIFNWNGSTGRIINDFDPNTHRSAIFGLSSYFEATNLNNSRVSQILSYQNTGDSTIVVEYNWNGSKYIQSPIPTNLTQNSFLPANLMNASLWVKVSEGVGKLTYSYFVANNADSRQAVQAVFLEGTSNWTSQSAPMNWTFIPWNEYPIAEWAVGGYPQSMVLQGQTKDDFILSGKDNPVIVTYHLQGNRVPPVFQNESEMISTDQYLNDMRTNSISGKTIGNSNSLASLDFTSFLDTLISYEHQCVTLGWLTNGPAHEKVGDPARGNEDNDRAGEGIVERLDRRLDKAKNALAKSDSVKARLELELFVNEVEQLYHKNKEEGERRGAPSLTSEGYALLKYNAEYLIARLPERHGRGSEGKHRGKK